MVEAAEETEKAIRFGRTGYVAKLRNELATATGQRRDEIIAELRRRRVKIPTPVAAPDQPELPAASEILKTDKHGRILWNGQWCYRNELTKTLKLLEEKLTKLRAQRDKAKPDEYNKHCVTIIIESTKAVNPAC